MNRRPSASIAFRNTDVDYVDIAAAVLIGAVAAGAAVLAGFGVFALLVPLVLLAALINQRILAVLLVVSMFVTRPSVDLGPGTIRLEILVCGIAATDLVLRGLNRETKSPLGSGRVFVIVALWITFLALVSITTSPEPTASLSTLIWMMFSVVGCAWIVRNRQLLPLIVRTGAVCTLVASGLAVLAYALATVSASRVGVQPDPTYGGFAAYVLSIEANILAILLTVWALIAAANPMGFIGGKLRIAVLTAVPFALFATHTRIAILALAIGLAIIGSKSAQAILAITIAGLAAYFSLPWLIALDPGAAKFNSGFDFSSGTEVVRAESWANAISQVSANTSNLFFGLGFNSYGQRNLDRTFTEGVRDSYLGNLALQILYDGGLISVALVFLVFVSLAKLAGTRWLSRPVIGVFVPFLLMSISTSSLWLMQTWFLVALAICCAAGVEESDEVQAPSPEVQIRT